LLLLMLLTLTLHLLLRVTLLLLVLLLACRCCLCRSSCVYTVTAMLQLVPAVAAPGMYQPEHATAHKLSRCTWHFCPHNGPTYSGALIAVDNKLR
jgi:hypothetical protein